MTMRRIGVMQTFPNQRKRRLQGAASGGRDHRCARRSCARPVSKSRAGASEAWIGAAVAEESRARLRELKPRQNCRPRPTRAALASGRVSAAEALAAQSIGRAVRRAHCGVRSDCRSAQAELARWVGDAADRPLAPIPTDREVAHSPEIPAGCGSGARAARSNDRATRRSEN